MTALHARCIARGCSTCALDLRPERSSSWNSCNRALLQTIAFTGAAGEVADAAKGASADAAHAAGAKASELVGQAKEAGVQKAGELAQAAKEKTGARVWLLCAGGGVGWCYLSSFLFGQGAICMRLMGRLVVRVAVGSVGQEGGRVRARGAAA